MPWQSATGHVTPEAAELLRALVDVARLEAGQPTSASIVAHVGREAAAGVLALREQARAALGESTAVAADSAGVLEAGDDCSDVDGAGLEP